MKKTLLMTIIFTLFFVGVVCAGSVPNWTITALNTTTPVGIPIPTDYKCGSISVYVSDGSDILISKDVAKTDERPMAEDALGEGWSKACTIPGTQFVFWARSTVGTPNLILLYQVE